MYDRYADIEKFITDPDKLQITNGSEVSISSEANYDIVIDLQGHTEEFEHLKPFIILVAKSICKLDNTVQKFENQRNWIGSSPQFHYDIAVVFLDDPYVILEYWGTEENTQFDVVFEHNQGIFTLKSFGTILDIPPDWEQMTPTSNEQIQKKSFFRRLIEWL